MKVLCLCRGVKVTLIYPVRKEIRKEQEGELREEQTD